MRISDWSSDVSSSDLAAFEAGNATATANVVDAARNAGITSSVHVSSLAAREPALSNYGWSKERAEATVQGSGLDSTSVRPPAVLAPDDTTRPHLFHMATPRIETVQSEPMYALYVYTLSLHYFTHDTPATTHTV